ncbi:MAG: hypothetical protein KZQ93_15730 [Candidatus Thiodiazotropha sp. (ex Monitilora ramsayi)]|nr:hypothetical protein [Candidatus Thiodiazotropha sp. (ex Monitilora ramsayi)]
MKTPFWDFTRFFPAALALITCADLAYAACSRSDVEYYLSKGFTPDQVTAICTSSSTPALKEMPDEQASPAVIPPAAKPGDNAPRQTPQNLEQHTDSGTARDNEQFLKIAIKGRDIQLTRDTLRYTRKMCVQIGEEDLYGFAPKACPDVKFVIALEGLEVLKTGKKYLLYGSGEAWVRGSIQREIIGQLADQKPRDRKLILEKMETGDQTTIPIREDISLERVEAALRELSI